MRVKIIIVLYFVLSGFFAKSQDLFGIPMNERDSVFIFFLEGDTRYYSIKGGTINDAMIIDYVIKMPEAEDLCFTSGYRKPSEYISTESFDILKKKVVLNYDYLYLNYRDENVEKLIEKLQWYTTNFFLVIPDSANQKVQILDVFNCNNYHN